MEIIESRAEIQEAHKETIWPANSTIQKSGSKSAR